MDLNIKSAKKITKIKGNGEKLSMLNWLSDPDSITPITSWAYSKESKPNKQKICRFQEKRESDFGQRKRFNFSEHFIYRKPSLIYLNGSEKQSCGSGRRINLDPGPLKEPGSKLWESPDPDSSL